MDYDKEINLLKFHLKMMTHAIDWETHSFLWFVVTNELDEHQTETLTKTLAVLRRRLEGEDADQSQREEVEKRLATYGISAESVYQEKPPTYKEFAGYCTSILGDALDPTLVLSYLKKQHIHSRLCTYLLNDSEGQP